MTPEELVSWAEATAAELLSPLDDRWRHVQGVADQAREVSRILHPDERPYLVAAAYLHDIGYAPSLVVTKFHPLDGAFWLHQLGQKRLARLAAYHSSARFEAAARGLGNALAAFTPENSPTADALTYCDMTTSPNGTRVTLQERLAEISERYGEGHLVVRSLREAYQHLAGAVERTQRRLRGASMA